MWNADVAGDRGERGRAFSLKEKGVVPRPTPFFASRCDRWVERETPQDENGGQKKGSNSFSASSKCLLHGAAANSIEVEAAAAARQPTSDDRKPAANPFPIVFFERGGRRRIPRLPIRNSLDWREENVDRPDADVDQNGSPPPGPPPPPRLCGRSLGI